MKKALGWSSKISQAKKDKSHFHCINLLRRRKIGWVLYFSKIETSKDIFFRTRIKKKVLEDHCYLMLCDDITLNWCISNIFLIFKVIMFSFALMSLLIILITLTFFFKFIFSLISPKRYPILLYHSSHSPRPSVNFY